MHLRTLTLIASSALLLSACATAKDRYLSAGYRLLSGEEIRALHLDMTHEVVLASGRTAVDYFTANGLSTFRRSDGVTNQGRWEIRGATVCYVYPNIPATERNCFSYAEKDGHYVVFKEFDDKKGQFGAEVVRISPGNVKNLPLE